MQTHAERVAASLRSLLGFANLLLAAMADPGHVVTHGYPQEDADELARLAHAKGFDADVAAHGMTLTMRSIAVKWNGALFKE